MVADLLEMRENQWFSEIRIDKFRLVIYKRGCYSLRFSFKMKVIG